MRYLKIALFFILIVTLFLYADSKLDATVEFSNTQLAVTNNDPYDWTEVEIKLNGQFKYKCEKIAAGNKLTIGLLNFAKKDGTRFNPFEYKLQEISIWASMNGHYCWAEFSTEKE